MRKVLILVAALVLIAVTAPAANPTAICPFDNQLASWTGQTRHDGKECQYAHIRFSYGSDGILTETKHVFWCDCDE